MGECSRNRIVIRDGSVTDYERWKESDGGPFLAELILRRGENVFIFTRDNPDDTPWVCDDQIALTEWSFSRATLFFFDPKEPTEDSTTLEEFIAKRFPDFEIVRIGGQTG